MTSARFLERECNPLSRLCTQDPVAFGATAGKLFPGEAPDKLKLPKVERTP
jgi:hypothetical protein